MAGTELPLTVPKLDNVTLFNRNGIRLMDTLKRMIDLQHSYCPENCKYHQTMMDNIQANPYCFTVTKTEYQGNGTGIIHVHFFESVFFVEYKPGQSRWEDINGLYYFPHTFASEMLYAIKYLQFDFNDVLRHLNTGINTGMNIYKEHPECFHPCFNLEREEERQALEVDRKALMEEKKQLESQKNQLRLIREALIKERRELESQKNQFRMECEADEIILLKPR